MFVRKKISVQKFFLVKKTFCLRKNFRSENKKIYVMKKICAKKNLGRKKFEFWIKCWTWKKCWVRKEFWVQKNFGSEIILGATISFLVCSVLVDFCKVLIVLLVTWVIWTPNPLNSARSLWLVYVSNFSLLAHPLLIDFGEGFFFLFFFLLWHESFGP